MGMLSIGTKSTTSDISWQFYSAAEFPRLSSKWDEIHHAASGLPIQQASFVTPLLKEFGNGRELIAIGYVKEIAIAMTILVRRYAAYTTFQPSQSPLGMWIHRPPHTLESIIPSLLRRLPGFTLEVAITQQDPDQVCRPTDGGIVETLDYIQTARVTVSPTFDEYWAARGKNLRTNTKRQRSRLEKDGIALRLETIIDPNDVATAIVDYSTLESAGWKAAGGTAVHPNNAQGRFYRNLLEDLCHRKVGRIFRYWYGNTVVAVDLCIENNETIIILKTTYDETIKNSSPASLMRNEYFRQIFDQPGMKRIEFFGRVMEWHTKWTSEVRTLYHVNFYRWPLLLRIRSVVRNLRASANPAIGKKEVDRVEPGAGSSGQAHKVEVYEDLASLPNRFIELFTLAGNCSVFLTFPWFLNFAQTALAANERVRIYAVDTVTSPATARAALLTRYIESKSSSSKLLSGLSNYYTSLFGTIVDPNASDIQAILNSLALAVTKDDKHRWHVINLRPLSIDRPTFPALVSAFENSGLLVRTYFCFGNWYLPIGGRSFAEYCNSLPSKLINTIKKKKEQLENSVKSQVIVYQDLASLDDALQAYEQVYAASWKQPEPQPEFIRGLCRIHAVSGGLRIGVLFVDDQAVAAQIWIINAGIASIYKLAHDKRFAHLSPGTVLTAHLMARVIDVDKVNEVDFLTGDDAYKKDWMSERRERWGILAFNPRTALGLIAFSRHVAGRWVKCALNFALPFVKAGSNKYSQHL